MSRYDPLRQHLGAVQGEHVTMRYAQIEQAVGPLPKSAFLHRAWWANHDGNVQARAWLDAGFIAEPDMPRRVVTFRRGRA